MQYRVYISSFYYVMADSEEEAIEKARDGDFAYSEEVEVTCEAVDDFCVYFPDVD